MTAATDPLARPTPPWYDEAKLGLFVHWSPASIPGWAPLARVQDLWDLPDDPDGIPKLWRSLPHAAMYQHALAIPASPTARHHAEHYGAQPYDAFVERFRDELVPACDPGPWADLAAASGARYVVLTTKLTDGFPLWPTAQSHPHKRDWRAQRDLVGETAAAVRAKGLRFGTYYCGGLDPTFGPLPVTSLTETIPHDPRYLPYAVAQWRELIERYQPSVLWNDFGLPLPEDELRAFFADYLARVPDGVVNNRFQATGGTTEQPSPLFSDFTTPEYSTAGSPDWKWEATRAIGRSFGYNRLDSERTYLSVAELVHLLADVVARGGNLLLNVNPTATGELPAAEAQRLLGLGWWLRTDGAAIYGTRPWTRNAGITPEGLPIRYTASPDAIHAIVLGSPRGAAADLDVFLADDAVVALERLPGAPLRWSTTPTGVRVELPEAPDERPALTLRLTPPDAVRPAA